MKPRYSPDNSFNVKDFEGVQRWLGLTGNRRFDFDKMTCVFGSDNRSKFKDIFGSRHQIFLDDVRFDVWRKESDELVFWLLSSKTKRTIIRVEKPKKWGTPEVKKVVIFLDHIYNRLKELDYAD